MCDSCGAITHLIALFVQPLFACNAIGLKESLRILQFATIKNFSSLSKPLSYLETRQLMPIEPRMTPSLDDGHTHGQFTHVRTNHCRTWMHWDDLLQRFRNFFIHPVSYISCDVKRDIWILRAQLITASMINERLDSAYYSFHWLLRFFTASQ